MSTFEHSIVEHPGVFIQDELEARGWSQRDLAFILDRPEQSISKIISGRAGVSPATAKELADAFDVSPELFANLQRAYDLAKAQDPDPGVKRRARLQTPYPVREMIKRGWLESTEPELLDLQMARFFEAPNVDSIPHIALPHAAKKTDYTETNPVQLAWLFRVRQLAKSVEISRYSEKRLRAALPELRHLMIAPEEVRHVPKILQDCGVRFVIVESLPGAKICGATTWLSKTQPVIGMTTLYDRIDNFWFVLRHEIEHVLCQHGQDIPVIDGDEELDVDHQTNENEKAANEASLEFGLPRDAFEKFMARKAPYVSRQDVLGFSKKHAVHPGIVVGRVQKHLDRWNFLNEYKVKIRSTLIRSALFDGWGEIAPVEL